MILDLSAIYSTENGEEVKEVHIDMKSFESKMGVFPVLKSEPFRLRLSNVENRQLLVSGRAEVTVGVPCSRCLAQVPVKLDLAVEKAFPIEKAYETGNEAQADGGSGDDGLERQAYVDGRSLDVDRMMYAEMLVAWPMKVLCKEDCKGICSKCGANLNEAQCDCDRHVADQRMAAFQDVFNKFKEV